LVTIYLKLEEGKSYQPIKNILSFRLVNMSKYFLIFNGFEAKRDKQRIIFLVEQAKRSSFHKIVLL
jgi:hypothetical protein